MKKITKIALIVFIVSYNLQSMAQAVTIKGGLNLAKMIQKDNDQNYSGDFKFSPGFHIGLTFDWPINEFVSFEPGLFFTSKGAREKFEESGYKMKDVINLYYVDVPITIKASHKMGNGPKIYGVIGPYAGVGVSGKYKITLEYLGDKLSTEEKITWGNDELNDDLKRLDLGLTVGAGVEFTTFTVGFSWDAGIYNISPDTSNGYKIKNTVLKFSMGYRFSK